MRAYILTDQGPAMRDAPKVAPRQGQVLVKGGGQRAEPRRPGHVHRRPARRPRRSGTVLGSEWSGVVEAIGPGVTDYAEGDRVMAPAPQPSPNMSASTPPTSCRSRQTLLGART